jgi:hypothetical protein
MSSDLPELPNLLPPPIDTFDSRRLALIDLCQQVAQLALGAVVELLVRLPGWRLMVCWT